MALPSGHKIATGLIMHRERVREIDRERARERACTAYWQSDGSYKPKMTTTIWNCAHSDTKSFESNYGMAVRSAGQHSSGYWVGAESKRATTTVYNESIYET